MKNENNKIKLVDDCNWVIWNLKKNLQEIIKIRETVMQKRINK